MFEELYNVWHCDADGHGYVLDEAACHAAAIQLGLTYRDQHEVRDDFPRGCYHHNDQNHTGAGVWFNPNPGPDALTNSTYYNAICQIGTESPTGSTVTATSLSPSTTPSTTDPTPPPSVAPVVASIISGAPTATATVTAGTPPLTQSATPTESSIVCTYESRPVCGGDGSTYSNQCVANSQGVAVTSIGACSSDLSGGGPGGSSNGSGLPFAAVVGLGVLVVGTIVGGVAWQRHRRLKQRQHAGAPDATDCGLYTTAVTLNPEYAPGKVAGKGNPEYAELDEPVYAVPGAAAYAVLPGQVKYLAHADNAHEYDSVAMISATDPDPSTETAA